MTIKLTFEKIGQLIKIVEVIGISEGQTDKHGDLIHLHFLGSFANLRKASVSSAMSVRLSAWLSWADFHEI